LSKTEDAVQEKPSVAPTKEFRMYSYLAHKTAIYPESSGLLYVTLGLNGEAGEIANKVKKIIRDSGGVISPEIRQALLDEAGDALWYINELCSLLGSSLEEVANANLNKLYSRKSRGVLFGSGDNR